MIQLKGYLAFLVFCLFLVFASGVARAEDDNLITWYKPEFPPLSIVNGPFAGKGYSDKIEAFLIKAMPEYRHEIQVAPFKRTVRDMQQGLNACSVTLLRTAEREQFIAFSEPARLLLPNGLIVRRTEADRFDAYKDDQGRVSVKTVIEAGKQRIGYANGRSYTKPIDTLLAANKGNPVLIERLGSEGPKGLLEMLLKGRIDAFFGQPVEAGYHGHELGVADDITVLPISEIKDFTVGYIGCSATPWGRKVIARVNALLTDAVKRADFRSFYEEFLDDAGRTRYRRLYAQFFGLDR